MSTPVDLLNRAEELAPVPVTKEQATKEAWVRHFCAQALAAYAGAHHLLCTSSPKERGEQYGALVLMAHASTSAALGLDTPSEDLPHRLWRFTPEAGALNGEWEEWLADTLDRFGVNPADVDDRYNAADFRSPSVRTEVSA